MVYLTGIVLIFLGALLVNKITGNSAKKSYFIIELPEYKVPSLWRAFTTMCGRGWAYIVKAATIILVCNTVVQIMQSFTWSFTVAESADESILASIAGPFAYLLIPIVGVLSWQLAAAAVTGFIAKFIPSNALKTLIEGIIRIGIFLGYILLVSQMEDIKRVFQYHGAEHKTITAYEKGLKLTVENVRKCRRVHDRCGTTFMFFVMFVSILVFSLFGAVFPMLTNGFLKLVSKLALLPLVAGLSYELLKLLSKTDSFLVYPLKLPGLLIQRITTREPDDDMIEVAITAFNKVLKMDADENEPCEKFRMPEKVCLLTERIKALLFN